MSCENYEHDKWPDLTLDDVVAFLNRETSHRSRRQCASEKIGDTVGSDKQRGMGMLVHYTLDRITAHKMGIRKITND